MWRFPDGTSVPSKGFLLVWADREDTEGEALHTNFRLSRGGGFVGLYTNEGAVVDEVQYGEQTPDTSFGRNFDGSSAFQFWFPPSPGAPNGSPAPGIPPVIQSVAIAPQHPASDQTVIVAAVILPVNCNLPGVRDSKQMSAKARERA